jgi:hypothetical protein
MSNEALLGTIAALAGYAIQWGYMKAQITTLTRRLDAHDDVKERLARIEAKLDLIKLQA